MSASLITVLFLAALALSVSIRLWLSFRQSAHVSAHRNAVPADFSAQIELAAHQKAADYTLAKGRYGRIDLALGIVWLLLITLGGGLQFLHEQLARVIDAASLWHGVLMFGALGFNLLVLLVYPTFIAPLFNKFKPLEDGPLKARIEGLMTRCGFRLSGLFVMDHELGHFKHKHLWQRVAVFAVISLAFLASLGWLSQQDAFYAGLGVSAHSEALALILFSAVLPAVTFPFTPLMSFWSRKHEFEADNYAKTHAQAADLVSALVKLYRDNAATLTPDPIHSLFYDSHPPAAIRISRLRAA
jgi:STE24 endopeptidase